MILWYAFQVGDGVGMSHGCGVARNGVEVREKREREVASTNSTAQGSWTAKRGACEAVNSERFVDVFAVEFGRVGPWLLPPPPPERRSGEASKVKYTEPGYNLMNARITIGFFPLPKCLALDLIHIDRLLCTVR